MAVRRRVADAMVTCPKTHGPETTVEAIRALFEDDHVHMALIVATSGRLVTTIERPDLAAAPHSDQVGAVGALAGRTVSASADLAAATEILLRDGRRRLAVVDDGGGLLGLLCLKRDRTGFCSDEGIRRRAAA